MITSLVIYYVSQAGLIYLVTENVTKILLLNPLLVLLMIGVIQYETMLPFCFHQG
jgi:hypothetical protein